MPTATPNTIGRPESRTPPPAIRIERRACLEVDDREAPLAPQAAASEESAVLPTAATTAATAHRSAPSASAGFVAAALAGFEPCGDGRAAGGAGNGGRAGPAKAGEGPPLARPTVGAPH